MDSGFDIRRLFRREERAMEADSIRVGENWRGKMALKVLLPMSMVILLAGCDLSIT